MKNVLHAWLVKAETLTEQIVGRDHKVVATELRTGINEKNVELFKTIKIIVKLCLDL